MQHLSRTEPASENAPDNELALRAARGDHAAFESIMRRHNRLLFRTARSVLRSDADAEEALQEAYLSAWRALSGFRSDARLSTWLVRIVLNEALGRLRRHEPTVIALDSAMVSTDPEVQTRMYDDADQRPEQATMRAQIRHLMEARIDMLPEGFRSVFMLRGVEELTVEEVAQALAIPEATVRTRYFRARSLLREGLSRDIDIATNDAFSFDGSRCNRIVQAVLRHLGEPGT